MEPPSTNAEETRKAWELVHSTTNGSDPATLSRASMSNMATMWETFQKNLEEYGIEFRPLEGTESYYTDDNDAEVVKARRSDLQLEPFDSPLLITKTDAELQILAQSGRSLIITKASQATCASWIMKTAQGDDQQINLAELAQYFSIFDPRDIQLWRLMKTDSDQFEAWQLDLGGKIGFSAVDDLKRFIIVWNTLISNLAGPVRRSLDADLEEIAKQTKKRQSKAKKTTSARKRHTKTVG
ncbi:MAG: hypothetical protein M1835_003654 [Candelina submexicana]|nr:MAG: hypothetical protein M1835_003654 [Candelina submexicana]